MRLYMSFRQTHDTTIAAGKSGFSRANGYRIDRVVTSIREMDPKLRDQVRAVTHTNAMNTGLPMGTQPGQAMYKKICAPCQTIGVGDRVGPDLRGVTERRDPVWLARYLRNPGAMLAQKDPVAVDLAKKFAPIQMPNLRLSEQDAADLISFLRQENAKLADAQAPSQPGGHSHHQHHHHKH
jgi:protein SCO1/2